MDKDFNDDFKLDFGSEEPLTAGDFEEEIDFDEAFEGVEISDDMFDFDDSTEPAEAKPVSEDMFNWDGKIAEENTPPADPVSRRKDRSTNRGLLAGIIAGAVIVVAVICVVIGLAHRGGGSEPSDSTASGETPVETTAAAETAEPTETVSPTETVTPIETAAPTTAPAEPETVYFPETSVNMIEIDSAYVQNGDSLWADADAVAAAEQLIDAANAAGYSLTIEKAYRDDVTEDSAADVKEHATGYVLDFTELGETRSDFVPDGDGTMDETLTWMLQNAADYGFVLSLAEDSISPLTYHYVYVGAEKAQEVEKDVDTTDLSAYVYYDDYLAQH